MRRLASFVAAAVLLAAPALAQSPGHVPEPAGLWQGALHGYTPNTVAGGHVLETEAFEKLLADRKPVLVDVAEPDKKPAGMSATAIWSPIHRTIPGSTWLPGAGSGTDDPGFVASFTQRFTDLAGHDKSRPIVVFCHPDCWGSWNAAKRLAGLGFTQIYWYPEGMEGWQRGHETAVVKPDAAWTAARSGVGN